MDKFEQRLKSDAEAIEASVSPELDARIRASLEGVTPDTPRNERPPPRSLWFWFASSLTGVAAAAILILVLNVSTEAPTAAPPAVAEAPALVLPRLDVRPAMLEPLETELENLKGDFRRAEQVVRNDIDKILGEPSD